MLSIIIAVFVVLSPTSADQGQRNQGKGQKVDSAAAPLFVEVVLENGQHSQLETEAIKKASSGPIKRGGLDFDFTPLTTVMKAAGIALDVRLRVIGADGNGMTLGRSEPSGVAAFDPEEFGFIFNQRGWPVLTPKPGSPHAAAPAERDRPQVRDVVRIEVVRP